MTSGTNSTRGITLIQEVDALNDEVKDLALNLALLLAKNKNKPNSAQLNRMEPEFVRLVNGTVRVVQELTGIVGAAQNQTGKVFDLSSGHPPKDQIERKLELISVQCNQILRSLDSLKGLTA